MIYHFEFDYPPGDLVCSFRNTDLQSAVEIVEKYLNKYGSSDKYMPLDHWLHEADKLNDELNAFVADRLSFMPTLLIPEEDDLSEFDSATPQNVPPAVKALLSASLGIRNLWLLQDKTEEMFNRYADGDLGFLSERRYKNFFQLPLMYSVEKDNYIVSNKAALQSVLGLDMINIISSKYKIHECVVCGEYYAVKGNYKSSACKKCRGKYAQTSYNESIANDPVKAMYSRYYQRYRKRCLAGTLPRSDFDEWCRSARRLREEYSGRYAISESPDIVREFEKEITIPS